MQTEQCSVAPHVLEMNNVKCGNIAATITGKDRYTVLFYATDHSRVDHRVHCKDSIELRNITHQKKAIKDAKGNIVAQTQSNKLISDSFAVSDNGLRAIIQKQV